MYRSILYWDYSLVANAPGSRRLYQLLAPRPLYQKRVLTSKNTIKKLPIKLVEYSGHYMTALACLDKLKIAWKEYCAAKKDAWSLRKTFLEGEIARKAHDRKVTTEIMVKMLK